MDELLKLIRKVKPEMKENELKECKILVSGGIIDSFEIIMLISEINRVFNVTLPIDTLVPENFESVSMIWDMIENYKRA